MNDEQRKAVAGFIFNLSVGYLLTFTIGPVLKPDPTYSTAFLAALGIVLAGALFVTGYRMLR